MNWFGSGLVPLRRVVDHKVRRGLVIAIVITTPAMALLATLRRGSRIAGASWAMLSNPEKARNAAAYPVISSAGVRGGPERIAPKRWMIPGGARSRAVAAA